MILYFDIYLIFLKIPFNQNYWFDLNMEAPIGHWGYYFFKLGVL